MSNDQLSPEARSHQIKQVSKFMREKHADPVWHAAWLEKTRDHHKRRKVLVDRALAVLKSQEASTT